MLAQDKRQEHECDGADGFDEVYTDREGDWILTTNHGCCKTAINFCPFCGIKLGEVKPHE